MVTAFVKSKLARKDDWFKGTAVRKTSRSKHFHSLDAGRKRIFKKVIKNQRRSEADPDHTRLRLKRKSKEKFFLHKRRRPLTPELI